MVVGSKPPEHTTVLGRTRATAQRSEDLHQVGTVEIEDRYEGSEMKDQVEYDGFIGEEEAITQPVLCKDEMAG